MIWRKFGTWPDSRRLPGNCNNSSSTRVERYEFIQAARQSAPAATIAHGQSLLWSGPSTRVQGVTGLTECESTADEWLQRVQESFRFACLSKETYMLYFMVIRRCSQAVILMVFSHATNKLVDIFCSKLACRKMSVFNSQAARWQRNDNTARTHAHQHIWGQPVPQTRVSSRTSF